MIPYKETYTYDVRFEGRCRGMGGRGKVKNELLLDVGGEVRGWGGVRECCGRPVFTFFIKENSICTMTRHHASNVLLARNLAFDSDVRQ